MSSNFSNALQLVNINDYIAPSQDCTKPIETIKKKSDAKRKIEIEGDKDVVSEGMKIEKPKKEGILSDCLSCTGCITSAETLLVQNQILDEVYKAIEDKKNKQKVLVISISPQSKASLAVRNKISYQDASKRLTTFFKKMGFDVVLDTTIGREISLLESAKEFVQRYKQHKASAGQHHLPLLSSSCPGWVCLVEKTLDASSLGHLSSVKSPQQMTASIVKGFLMRKLNLATPSSIYHVAVAPCYDRKLEASRKDFYSEEFDSKDVDCVLATVEVQDMLDKEHVSLADLQEETSDQCPELLENVGDCWTHERSDSDGYMDYIARYAAKELFNVEVDALKYEIHRHVDMQEVNIYGDKDKAASSDEQRPLLRFAFAYGIAHINNVARKLKRNQLQYDYMEIMSCPSGCINGIAQVRGQDRNKVKQEYHSVTKRPIGSHPIVDVLHTDWLERLTPEEFKNATRTQFRIVSDTSSMTAW